MEKKKKIIVVGAGPGGLSAAMILAKKGFDVNVYEKKDVVGGRNSKIKVGESFFDVGPTFLMMKFVLDNIFKLAGKNVNDYLKFKKLDPMYRLVFDDREVFVYDNKKKMISEIEEKFPGEGRGFEKFMKKEKKRFERMMPCLDKDYSYFGRFFHKDFILAIPYLGIIKTIFDVLGKYFKSEKLKLSFTFQAKYLGMSAWECPGGFAMIPYVEHEFGIYHVMGGLNKISEAMAKATEEEGGNFFLNSKVREIIIEKNAAKGIVLENGEKIYADEIVINEDFANAMSELFPEGSLRKYSRKNLEMKKYSCSTFMLYLELDKKYDLDHHSIFFARDYKKNVEDIFKTKKISEEFSFYVQNACVSDPSLAPEGKSTIYVLVPMPNATSGINWKKEKEDFTEKVIASLESRAGMSDVRKHITSMKIHTPQTWIDEYAVFYGATFNLSHSIDQMLYFRPHNKFEEIDNCYLVGGGTHPGSGLPTIYESGRISAEMICHKYNKSK